MKTMTIKDIKEKLTTINDDHDPFITMLADDTRQGVKNLLKQWRRMKEVEKHDYEHYQSMLVYERELTSQGLHYIAGIDEVGRGPLAGPVVSAAVILPEDCYIRGLNDSKKLTEKKRTDLFTQIMKDAHSVGIGVVSSDEIDRLNIYQATIKSMLLAIQNLHIQPEYLLIDAMNLNSIYPEMAIVKGDMKSASIAAASIVAKVTRDRMMDDFHLKYPEYGFNIHKGYGTKVHLDAIQTNGPCPIHRTSFAPIKTMIKGGS